MERIQLTGGARIGWVDTIWPFATLSVTPDLLILNSHIMGTFHFFPSDIISIEPYGLLPIITHGIRINHRNAKYNTKIVFWVFKNPKRLIEDIETLGFWGNDKDNK